MSLTMGQQLAIRRIRCRDPFATAADIAVQIRANQRDVELAMHKRTPHAPVFRGKKVRQEPKPKDVPYHRTATDPQPFGRVAAGLGEAPSLKVPQDVLLERERRMALSPQSFTASWLGDPLPGYSALDKRRGA